MSCIPFSEDSIKAIRNRRTLERVFERAIITFFDRELTQTLRAARNGRTHYTASDIFKNLLMPYLQQAAMIGAMEGLEPLIAFGIGFDGSLVNRAAIAFAREHVGELITQIDGTTRRTVQTAVSDWLQTGGKIDELSRTLAPTFGPDRARTIAITEVTNAVSGGNIASWREVNKELDTDIVSGMRWLTANDERVCPICAPLGGLTFGEDGAEPATIAEQRTGALVSGLDAAFVHPGGAGAAGKFSGKEYQRPPAHPRCRCGLAPVVN